MSQTAYLQDILWQTKSQQWTHQQSNHHLCYFVRASLACLQFIATVCHRSLIEGDPPGVHTKGFRTKKQQQPLIVSSRLARQSRSCFAEPILHPKPKNQVEERGRKTFLQMRSRQNCRRTENPVPPLLESREIGGGIRNFTAAVHLLECMCSKGAKQQVDDSLIEPNGI